jgi:nucleoside-diphosphate-sugar epimerase
METVLVTGGAGFIGSHTCKALASHGFLPAAFDDLSRGHAHFVRWGPLVNGDILDLAALDAAFERHRPGAVQSGVGLRERLRGSSRGQQVDYVATTVMLAGRRYIVLPQPSGGGEGYRRFARRRPRASLALRTAGVAVPATGGQIGAD